MRPQLPGRAEFGPRRRYDQQRRLRAALGQRLQHVERGRIGPVQVLEREHDRLSARAGEDPGDERRELAAAQFFGRQIRNAVRRQRRVDHGREQRRIFRGVEPNRLERRFEFGDVGSRLMRVCEPEIIQPTDLEDIRAAAWLGGFFDEDGTAVFTSKNSTLVSFYPGRSRSIADRLEDALERLRFSYGAARSTKRRTRGSENAPEKRWYWLQNGGGKRRPSLPLLQRFLHVVRPTKWRNRIAEGALNSRCISSEERSTMSTTAADTSPGRSHGRLWLRLPPVEILLRGAYCDFI
jgi:hypothetical protein